MKFNKQVKRIIAMLLVFSFIANMSTKKYVSANVPSIVN